MRSESDKVVKCKGVFDFGCTCEGSFLVIQKKEDRRRYVGTES